VPNEIHPYDDFWTHYWQVTSRARSQIEALLKILEVNPYDPDLQRKCLIHGERFEYELDGGYSIIWSVHQVRYSILAPKMEVLLLAIPPL
jgi:hypothetical protein